MAAANNFKVVVCACAVIGLTFSSGHLHADDASDTKQQLQQLQEQNRALQEQLRQQQSLIDTLNRKVEDIQQSAARPTPAYTSPNPEEVAKRSTSFSLAKVSISGEGGVGYFHSGSEGIFPNGEFRVDEAKLFVESPIWNSVYFFTEINLMTRQAFDVNVKLGECYLDFENVSELWHRERMLNVRLGRMDIPFGEEYQSRDAIDNPFISHSLSDLWGVDEGIELYGSVSKVSYVVAVQNGGASGVRDFTPDKSVAGRLSFDPARWLHLSVSGMRTGDLAPPDDYWSELYVANGWIVPIGSSDTTRFHAELVEGDVELRLPRGHLKTFGGYIRSDDNDPNADNHRHLYYYAVEAVHALFGKLYAGARFSQIFADNGYPLAGNGDPNKFLFSGALTQEIWRLSLGLGYRWSQNLLFKADYSFERGRLVSGETRNHEDLFALEAAFKF
jgi:hypothetical protein